MAEFLQEEHQTLNPTNFSEKFSYRTACCLGKIVAPGELSGKHTMILTELPETGKFCAILFSVGSVGRNGRRKEPSTRTLTPLMPQATTEYKISPSLAAACYVCRTSANTRSPTIGRFCGMTDVISVSGLQYNVLGNERSWSASEILYILGGTIFRRRDAPPHLDPAHRSEHLLLLPVEGGS